MVPQHSGDARKLRSVLDAFDVLLHELRLWYASTQQDDRERLTNRWNKYSHKSGTPLTADECAQMESEWKIEFGGKDFERDSFYMFRIEEIREMKRCFECVPAIWLVDRGVLVETYILFSRALTQTAIFYATGHEKRHLAAIQMYITVLTAIPSGLLDLGMLYPFEF